LLILNNFSGSFCEKKVIFYFAREAMVRLPRLSVSMKPSGFLRLRGSLPLRAAAGEASPARKIRRWWDDRHRGMPLALPAKSIRHLLCACAGFPTMILSERVG
jgi:hypothetical protein